MSMLREIQDAFADALLDVHRPPPSALTANRSGSSPIRRFAVYRNNVAMSLTEILEAYFPVVQRLLGVEFFRAVVREFIIKHPPKSPILSRYGEDLPAFLARFEPVADLYYLPDVALMEWLQLRAYHAADARTINAERLSRLDAGQVANMRLVFHPAARFLSSRYPIFSIWRTNTFDAHVVPLGQEAGPEAVLIVRPQLEVRTLLLPKGGDVFLALLLSGATIADAFERAAETEPDFDLTAILSALIELGALCDIDTTPHSAGGISQQGTRS